MNHIFNIPNFQRKKTIPKKLKDLELLPLNEQFSKLTMPIISDDEMRPVMMGNFFDMESKKIVSTDAMKLTAINMPNETFNFIKQTYKKELNENPKGLIFHTLSQLQKDYNELLKLATKNNNNDVQSFSEYVKIREIEDGRYPNYDAVIPREFTNQINVDYQKLYWYAKVLLDAKVIDDKNKLNSSNETEYQNKKIEYLKDSYVSFIKSSTRQIILTYILDDGTIQYIGFNAKFLCDILRFAMELNGKTFGKVGLSGSSRAMVIELQNGLNATNDSVGLIMPITLSDNKTIGDIDFGNEFEMYYDLDTNSIISDKVNYPIDSSIGYVPSKDSLSNPIIRVEEKISKVENNSADFITNRIKGLKIALKVARAENKPKIQKRILGLEIAKKMQNPKFNVGQKMYKIEKTKNTIKYEDLLEQDRDIQSEIDEEKRKPKNEQSELKRLRLEREVILRKIDEMEQFNKGGVVFTNYNGSEIMYEPNYEEYFVNDILFYSMEEAKNYIDSGESENTKFMSGGRIELQLGDMVKIIPNYASIYTNEIGQIVKEMPDLRTYEIKLKRRNGNEFVKFDKSELIFLGNQPRFANGGNVSNENYEMLKNKSIELLHHSKELQEVVKKQPKTPAWVISKSSRASTDLSDITHYLESKL